MICLSFAYSDLFENLAWASAQIHCQCSINEKLILGDKIKADVTPAVVNTGTFILINSFIYLSTLFSKRFSHLQIQRLLHRRATMGMLY